jgi:anti-sigma factor RsiW
MSSCRDLEPLFTSYVDGEAAAGERASIDAHLERCPPCRTRVVRERAARQILIGRRERLQVCASGELRTRCAAQFRIAGGASRPAAAFFSRRLLVPLSLAATVVLAVAGVLLFGLTDPVEALAAQLAMDHVKCFQFSPGTAVHVDPDAMGRDWSGSQGWAIHVPASSPSAQLELLGLRRCAVTEGRTAHLMYRWRGQPLSVFVLPRTLQSGAGLQQIVEKFGHESIVWSDRGRTYVVVVRGRPDGVEPVVGYLKAHAR